MSKLRISVGSLVVIAACLALGVTALMRSAANDAAETQIVVWKSERRLELYQSGGRSRSFRIGLGLNPVDDKIREGDRCTPEGYFYITSKNGNSSFHRSLGLSYPNVRAAQRGRSSGLITREQYREILRALRRNKNPPQHTPLGGEIMIHGGGSGRDWTWGCIALENRDVDVVFNAVSVGTPVIIRH